MKSIYYNDLLESSFLLNLCIFSVATFYVSEEVTGDRQSRIQNILSGISIGIAFAYFIGILVFHVCQRLHSIHLFSGSIDFFQKFNLIELLLDEQP